MKQDRLHAKIRSECHRAAERAQREYDRAVQAEEERTSKRLRELSAKHEVKLAGIHAMLDALPKEADEAHEPPTPEDDDAPDMVQVPAALREPYVPRSARK